MLEKFSNKALSKEQMKSIQGGKMMMCGCSDTGSGCNVGLWEGNYSSVQQMANDLNEYCACGGSCWESVQ